jgi:hypothetical protein
MTRDIMVIGLFIAALFAAPIIWLALFVIWDWTQYCFMGWRDHRERMKERAQISALYRHGVHYGRDERSMAALMRYDRSQKNRHRV